MSVIRKTLERKYMGRVEDGLPVDLMKDSGDTVLQQIAEIYKKKFDTKMAAN